MDGSWRARAKCAAGAAGCVVLGAFAFALERPVPGLEYVNLAVHEAGHLFAIWLPPAAMAMMGSIAQVALPLLIAACFLAHGERVGAGLCLAWAGASARDVSVYIADAPYQRLPLIGGEHDWARLLGPSHFDCIDRAADIAGAVHGAGFVLVLLGVVACALAPLGRREAPRRA